jgi:hypothetical protein
LAGLRPLVVTRASAGWCLPGRLCSRHVSTSCRTCLGGPPPAGGDPAGCVHGTSRHPVERALAGLRRLVVTRASGPGAFGRGAFEWW